MSCGHPYSIHLEDCFVCILSGGGVGGSGGSGV